MGDNLRKRARSYLALVALACGALYFAADLSADGRTAIDWAVLSLIAGAILWNLVRLGQRLHRAGGGKDDWHLARTAGFWVVGLLNTWLIRPDEVGSWKNILGWVLIVLAALDTIAIARKEHAAMAGGDPPALDPDDGAATPGDAGSRVE